jgi:imidazoleglycerol phosphate dehydratase HisB
MEETKMRYSLVSVINEADGFIDGVWIQDHHGTIDTAIKIAKDLEAVNGNKISVAVVECLNGASPNYCLRQKLTRLG